MESLKPSKKTTDHDTIDVEEFANKMKTGIVTFFTGIVMAKLVEVAPWIVGTFLRDLLYDLIERAVGWCATEGGLTAYYINTMIITTDQMDDYVTAIDRVEALPDNVSDEEWEKVEREASHAFRNLTNFRR